jgi:hypothetical protein
MVTLQLSMHISQCLSVIQGSIDPFLASRITNGGLTDVKLPLSPPYVHNRIVYYFDLNLFYHQEPS